MSGLGARVLPLLVLFAAGCGSAPAPGSGVEAGRIDTCAIFTEADLKALDLARGQRMPNKPTGCMLGSPRGFRVFAINEDKVTIADAEKRTHISFSRNEVNGRKGFLSVGELTACTQGVEFGGGTLQVLANVAGAQVPMDACDLARKVMDVVEPKLPD
ncbi:DUF3558 domain-containing protein [Allokutzneria sp. A3M-2-11 16]|uniref:DUF3558 family protein n=1 Tax=Allokutzneria sp. A3M-2-11 16 TaxID=2962043 RepID=UPI0020B81B66|nr:DUF3558 family protein [Allokutzneria sp. A3M-2-11 16]MCP3798584.1 DUF3558 domain-containing protein [Allokutzneria sp. A3M-2-11 16]